MTSDLNTRLEGDQVPRAPDVRLCLDHPSRLCSNPPMRLIVIGTGRRARSYVEVAKKSKAVSWIGVSGNDPGRRDEAAKSWGVEAVESRQLFESADGFILSNASKDHAESLNRMIPCRKPILIEKPVTIDARQTSRILGDIRNHNTPFIVAFQRRLNRTTRSALNILSNAGTPGEVDLHILGGHPTDPASIRTCLLREGIHSLDLLFFILSRYPRASSDIPRPAVLRSDRECIWTIDGLWPFPVRIHFLSSAARCLHRNSLFHLRLPGRDMFFDDMSIGSRRPRLLPKAADNFMARVKCKLGWIATSREILSEFLRVMGGGTSALATGDFEGPQILLDRMVES